MLGDHLGNEMFLKGVAAYLKKHAYGMSKGLTCGCLLTRSNRQCDHRRLVGSSKQGFGPRCEEVHGLFSYRLADRKC